jgi:phage shock protein PspC (stress-responsive transcriptional regulator)
MWASFMVSNSAAANHRVQQAARSQAPQEDPMTASTTTQASSATHASAAPRRWVGGVASTVAGRTRIPVAVLRVGWVGAVCLGSSTGEYVYAWVPIICYIACWWTLSKKRQASETQSTAPAAVPVQRPAATAPVAPTAAAPTPVATASTTLPVAAAATATASTAASEPAVAESAAPTTEDTPERARLKDFVRFIWGTQPTPQPTYTADLTGAVLTGLQLPGGRNPGYYAPRMPFGKLYVYPDYLVFLTESHNKPGVVPSASRCLSVLLDAWRSIGFWRPIPMARKVYQAVTTDEVERLRKPLGNPNSIVVRRSEITGVSVRKYQMLRYIVIETVDSEIMLAPNNYLGLVACVGFGFLLLRSVRMNAMGVFGLPWDAPLVRELNKPATPAN